MKRLLILPLLFLAAACVGDHSESVDVAAHYDAFGEEFSPLDAVPVQAVVADGAGLVGKPVKIEGKITEVCQGMGCWLSFQIVDGPLVRIDVPRDDAGAYVYTFPKDAAGRRAIISGVLAEGAGDHHAEGSPMMAHEDGEEGHHDEDGESHHAMGDMDGDDHHAEGDTDEHHAGEEAMEGHDEAETRVLNESVYTLTATGALIERIRA